MSNNRPQDVADILEGMDAPTPNEVYVATREYDTNYIAAAAASKAHAAGGGGGSQPFVTVAIRHSADFANITSNAPVAVVPGVNTNLSAAVILPPSAFGNDGSVKVTVASDLDVGLEVGGSLVVQNADGTVWLEQDTNTTTHIGPTGTEDIDFDTNGGGAGAGLSWGAVARQIDIASAGVFSAFVVVYVALA